MHNRNNVNCERLQKLANCDFSLEIYEIAIYDIATEDIAPRTIYHTGAKTSREEAQGMNKAFGVILYILGYACGILLALKITGAL